ncbi:MAG: high-potential iron-sulfur protein [Steroidobacterales bacterium]
MSRLISRRDALKQLGLAAGACAALPAARQAAAAERPHLLSTDPTAIALGYVEDARLVDPKKNPSFQPSQNCLNCLQLQGNPADTWRPCNLFPGKLVNSAGWCRVWIKKG